MSTHKTKLVCFRLTPTEKSNIHTLAKLQGINPSDIFRNYALALLAKKADVYPPQPQEGDYYREY